ncbi:MAG: RNA polymerase sigma factor [Firmicutes bacterium]|nr:RNA polymerase sigma factor [Bacillota bacterium]
MIDQRVIDRLKKKDEQAFEYVYQETKRGVYSMIFSVIKNHQVTEDIMQDVYMKMMTTISQYKKQTNFKNWIITIAKNQAIDYYRREKRIVHVDQTDYDNFLSSPEPTPDERNQFDLMIEMLSEDQRSVVILKIADEMKFKDIAKVLEKPIGTVIWLYQEAIKTLKRYEG